MNDFFFFAETDLLMSQSDVQAFGPVITNPTEQYNVCSRFTSTTESAAFAVCDGIILVQQDSTNPGLVNIALRPLSQGRVKFGKIEYFIYRGILKSSLIDGIEIAVATNNDLTASIWNSQNQFNDLNGTSDNPSANALGINISSTSLPPYNFDDTDLLGEGFSIPASEFQLPTVRGGWSIGKFQATNFSLEIIVSDNNYDVEFGILRQSTNVVVANPVSSSNSLEIYNSLKERRRILNYIDPCAFYGLFFWSGIKKKGLITDTSFSNLKDDDLYAQILTKFFTNNLIYVDIRNEHGLTFNSYQNYDQGIQISVDGSSFNQIDYDDGNGWPIIKINAAQFSNSGLSGEISIKLPHGDNDIPKVLLVQGYYKDQYPNDSIELTELQFEISGDWTNSVNLKTPKNSSSEIIPFYICMRYLKGIVTAPDSPTTPSALTLFSETYIDNLFDLRLFFNSDGEIKFPFQTSSGINWWIPEYDNFVDSTSGSFKGYMGKAGIAEDLNAIYFFSYYNGAGLKSGGVQFPLVNGTKEGTDFLSEVLSPIIELDIVVHKVDLVLSTTSVSSSKNSIPDFYIDNVKLSPTTDSLIVLAFSKAVDLPKLQIALSQFNDNSPARLVIRDVNTGVDTSGNSYTEGTFKVLGYDIQVGTINTQEISTDIKFYQKI